MRTVLVVAANPLGTEPLQFGEEVRLIRAEWERSRCRDQFEIREHLAARWEDLRRYLVDYSPEVVHFVGHGHGQPGLAFEQEGGKVQEVPGDRLADMLKVFESVRCVVLNACSTEPQGEAIARYVPAVVAMTARVGDQSAARFAGAFYGAVFGGLSYAKAVEVGRAEVLSNVDRFQIVSWIKPDEPKVSMEANLRVSRVVKLEVDRLQIELADLEQDYISVQNQLRWEQDGPTQNRLKRQIEQIAVRMAEVEAELDRLGGGDA